MVNINLDELFTQSLKEEISKEAAEEAIKYLKEIAPINYNDLTNQQHLLTEILNKYKIEIPQVLRDLQNVEDNIKYMFSFLSLVSDQWVIQTIKDAQITLNKSYAIIFSLREYIMQQKAIYELVFSDQSQKSVRVTELSLSDLFPLMTLSISNISKKGKVQLGLQLANLHQLQLMRNELNSRTQTQEEQAFAKIMFNRKENGIPYARTAELAAAAKRGADVSNIKITKDNASARSMQDVSQYMQQKNKNKYAIEVKHFGTYYDRESREKKYGTTGLMNFASLKNDLIAIYEILNKNSKNPNANETALRIKALKQQIYKNEKFINQNMINSIKNSALSKLGKK